LRANANVGRTKREDKKLGLGKGENGGEGDANEVKVGNTGAQHEQGGNMGGLEFKDREKRNGKNAVEEQIPGHRNMNGGWVGRKIGKLRKSCGYGVKSRVERKANQE